MQGDWLQHIDSEMREAVFVVMRRYHASAEKHHESAARLRPPAGQIEVGGAAFEQTLKATVIDSYLRALRNGKAPITAREDAARERNAAVDKWKARRGDDVHTHRTTDAEQTLLENLHREILRAAGKAALNHVRDVRQVLSVYDSGCDRGRYWVFMGDCRTDTDGFCRLERAIEWAAHRSRMK